MKLTISLLSISLFALGVGLFFTQMPTADSAGLWPVHIQSATTTTVGTSAVTLFADDTTNSCKARVVTTNGTGVSISFDDVTGFGSTTISVTKGHWQPASTTVVYDSALYGCGLMSAIAAASTPVTISSF